MRAWRVVLIVCVICGAAALLIRGQRDANRAILDSLGQVKSALDQQTRRAGELEQQVAALNERVVSLEREVVRLRQGFGGSHGSPKLSTGPAEIALANPAPIEAIALAPLVPGAEPLAASSVEEGIAIETLPITWSTDWTSYQPAGIIAPSAPIVLERRLTDPAFVKKMYIAFVALQAADVASTTVALNRGAREANPLLRDVANSPAALIGVKAAVTVTTILAMEKLRKQHPVVASVTLIAINATLAAVAINNVSVAASSGSR